MKIIAIFILNLTCIPLKNVSEKCFLSFVCDHEYISLLQTSLDPNLKISHSCVARSSVLEISSHQHFKNCLRSSKTPDTDLSRCLHK